MFGCKLCSTQVASGSKMASNDGIPLSNQLSIGVLLVLYYLILERPDICYAVNQVCQLILAPTTTHDLAVKRILHYLKDSVKVLYWTSS